MKTLSELLPLAAGIAVLGGITWFMLDRGIGLGRWLLAAMLFAHGWVHLLFVFPQPAPGAASAGATAWPFDLSSSWLITNLGVQADLVRGMGIVVMAAVFVAFIMAALATIGVLVPATWWTALVVVSALGSTLLLALFFSPALTLGFAIDAVLVWLVLARVWIPAGGGAPSGLG